MKEVAEKVRNECGRSFNKTDLNRIIVEQQKKMITEAGHVPINVPDKLKDSTLRNYATQIAIQPNISLVTSTVSKTNGRYAAERSWHAAIALLALIARTHYVKVPKESEDVRKDMQTLPKSTTLLYDLVTQSAGVPVVPIHPMLITSTDEQTEFIFEGAKSSSEPFRLVSTRSLQNHGTYSPFSLDDGNYMVGTRNKDQVHLVLECYGWLCAYLYHMH